MYVVFLDNMISIYLDPQEKLKSENKDLIMICLSLSESRIGMEKKFLKVEVFSFVKTIHMQHMLQYAWR